MSCARAKGAGALVVLWAIACAGGLGLLWRYEAVPGDPGAPPATWPEGIGLTRAPAAPTLVMIAHPRCTCTRASVAELNLVVQRAPRDVATHVVFVVPDGVDVSWEDGELYERARAIPGVHVLVDRGGVVAARLGVAASGHVLVYDAAGALRFSGGITGSRGHQGDNAGRRRVLSLLNAGETDRAASDVFGCGLEDPT